MAQYTETVGWVPEDAEATMKREVGDEVGNMAGGTETVLKVTRPYMDRDGPAVTLQCRVPGSTRPEVQMSGNLIQPVSAPDEPCDG